MTGMIVAIIIAALTLITYEVFVWRGLNKKYNGKDPDCVTCNGYPVSMISYTLGYYGDVFFDEPLCTKHHIQGSKIIYLEAVVLDKEWSV